MRNDKVVSMMGTKVSEQTILAVCKEFGMCKMGFGFIAKSTPRFAAPKQTAAMWLNEFGTEMPTIVKVTKVSNARSGSYQNKVNKVATTEFVSGSLNGYEWLIPNMVKRVTKDGSLQLCIAYSDTDKTSFVSEYIINGERFATPAEVAFIKSRLYTAPASQKQLSAGVSFADIVSVRNYKFSNVLSIGKNPIIEQFWESLTK